MGGTAASLRTRCVYGCAGEACASQESYDGWLAVELYQAIGAQDKEKIQELINLAPQLKERTLSLPEQSSSEPPMTALGLALQRRDPRSVKALLDAGVSPNLPISEQQRGVYAHRSQLAALNGGDPDLQNLVPGTHFEALCATQHKELFFLLLEKSANPNSGIIQVCHCGDAEMLEALIARGAQPNTWARGSTPLISAVKSKINPYDKVLSLLKAQADPNFMGTASKGTSSSSLHPPLTLATRKRDYRMVRLLLEAGADVNLVAGDEGLPNALFWATYWGELELIKLFVTLSKHRLDLSVRKYTNETVFDVAYTSKNFAELTKPRHIAKLPLPSRPPYVYKKIAQMLEEYRAQYPEAAADPGGGNTTAMTGSTTATRRLFQDSAERGFGECEASLGSAGPFENTVTVPAG